MLDWASSSAGHNRLADRAGSGQFERPHRIAGELSMVDVEDVFLPVEGFKQRTGIRAQGDVLATDGFLQEPSTHAADHAQRVGLAFGEGCMAGEMGHQHGRCDRMPDVLRLSETIERQALVVVS